VLTSIENRPNPPASYHQPTVSVTSATPSRDPDMPAYSQLSNGGAVYDQISQERSPVADQNYSAKTGTSHQKQVAFLTGNSGLSKMKQKINLEIKKGLY